MATVEIYTRAFCGYCAAALKLLKNKQVEYQEYDATMSPDLRREMTERSGRETFPQIFIDGRHIGGYDDINALDREQKLDELLGVK